MNDEPFDALEEARAIAFICMMEQRYPYLSFRQTRLGTLSLVCLSDPVDGLPEHWMLMYLYSHQELLRGYLSPPYQYRAVD